MPKTLSLTSAGGLMLDLLFPIECLGCEKPGHFLCPECVQNIDPYESQVCPICDERSSVGMTHGACRTSHMIDGIFVAGNFRNYLLKSAIKKFKYKNVQNLGLSLAQFLGSRFMENFSSTLNNQSWQITYVPLYPAREKQRGYNQSKIIAENLSKMLGLPYIDTLARIRSTLDQTKLRKDERQKNIESAFIKKAETEIKNINFLLVDDVATTGSTLKECAKVLKRNGAGMVLGLAVAKD